jgi:hypothetical protein
MPAKCVACGKEIHWLKHHVTEKPAPIEAEKYRDGLIEGNIVISLETEQYRIATAAEYERSRVNERPMLHVNHFARCPKANEFKSKGGRKRKEKR